MTIILIEGKKLIQSLLIEGRSVRSDMSYLLDFCAKTCESPAWKQISELNFEKDAALLQNWLNKTLTRNPPPESIRAFWFGLNNPTLNDGELSCSLYISGSIYFDATDVTCAWACLDPDSYIPDDNYAKSGVLHEMYYQINKYEVSEIGEYMLCLGYACLAIKSALNKLDKRFLSGAYGLRPVAVGFDNGDFIFI